MHEDIKAGDLIVANHSSYIDILHLFTFYSPVFVEIVRVSNNDNQPALLRIIPFHHALFKTGEYPQTGASDPNGSMSLTQICKLAKKNHWGPVVIFPEGTTTNGRALLQFVDPHGLFDVHDPNFSWDRIRIHVFGFRYIYLDYSPTYTVGGKLSHLIGLAAQYVNTLSVNICRYNPSNFQETNRDNKGTQQVTRSEAIRKLLVQVTQLKQTSLGIKDKRDFFDAWAAKMEQRTNN
ncbi:hypothetical protein BDR26DRAFT_879379 [Obelidium mucronatum]|nr:hypothetical protein BDR26DRAFT_879379 [Obelidium mucronatum]